MPAASIPPARPTEVRVVYDRESARAGAASVRIGHRRCALRLEPDRSVSGAVSVLELTLRCRGLKHGEDLLAGPWHGLQPYDFPAVAMADGPQRSIQGDVRIIRAARIGVVLKVRARSAAVSPAGDDYDWRHLDLGVSVSPAGRG